MTIKTLDLFADTVLVSLERHRLGFTRKVANESVGVEIDRRWFRSSKTILRSPEYVEIGLALTSMKNFLDVRRAPGNFFRPGCFLVRKKLVPEIQAQVKATQERLAAAVEAFLATYEQRKAEARVELEPKGLYAESDYPTPAQIRVAISVSVRYVELSIPEELPEEIKQQQREQLQAEVKQAVDEIRLAMRESALQLFAHLSERLQPSKDGDKKVLQDRAYERLLEFMEHFDDRDITDDEAARAVIREAREALSGVDVSDIRDDAGLRSAMADVVGEINDSLTGLVKEQRSRMIELED